MGFFFPLRTSLVVFRMFLLSKEMIYDNWVERSTCENQQICETIHLRTNWIFFFWKKWNLGWSSKIWNTKKKKNWDNSLKHKKRNKTNDSQKNNVRTTQHWFKPTNLGQILHYHKHKLFWLGFHHVVHKLKQTLRINKDHCDHSPISAS